MEEIIFKISGVNSIIVSDYIIQIDTGYRTSNLIVIDEIKFVSEIIESRNEYSIRLMVGCFIFILEMTITTDDNSNDDILAVKELLDDLVITSKKNKYYSFNKPKKIDI